MPYIDIVRAKDDYASIWYTTNSPTGTVSSFAPEKPTVIMFHPIFLDSTWLDAQFDDPRINNRFNIIAFDARCAGKTVSRPNGRHDHWTDCADLAQAILALWLPPAHLWASESFGTNTALRLAMLFPEMVLSITMLTVPSPTELKAYFAPFDDILNRWVYAEDLDTIEHTLNEIVTFLLGTNVHPDLLDDLIAYLETRYPPYQRSRIGEMANTIMNRTALEAHELAAVYAPCLLIHGEDNQIHPLEYAERMKAELVNAKGGAKLFVLKGCEGYLNVVPSIASLSNQVFVKFMARQPPVRSELRAPREPLEVRMKRALRVLADFAEDESIAERDPLSSMSFSRVTAETQKLQEDMVRLFASGQHKAFSPLGADGRPMRKYSERQHDHWFLGDSEGYSYSDTMDRERISGDIPMPPSVRETAIEPVSNEIMQEGALRRTALPMSPASVEQYIVKGNVSRVVNMAGYLVQDRLIEMDVPLGRPTNDSADGAITTSSRPLGEAVERPSVLQVLRQEGDRYAAANNMALAMRRRRNNLLPISKLPDDILSRIMILYRDISNAEFTHPLRWLAVTLVCCRWRTLALGSPLLWNCIYWKAMHATGSSPPEGWIMAFLQRFAEVPLDLDVHMYHLESDIQDLLISHSFRWRNVVLRAAPAHIPSLIQRLTASTPLLESFRIIRDVGLFAGPREDSRGSSNMEFLVPENTFGGHAPSLRLLALTNSIHVHPNSPFLCLLTSLEVCADLHERNILAVLASASNLHSLQIIRIPTTVVLTGDGAIEPAGHFSPDDPVQPLRRLQDLNIWSSLPLHCLHLLTHLDLPVLRRLRINILSVYDSDEIASLLDVLLSFAHTVQRNEAPIHGIYVSHHESGFTIGGWSFAQIQAMNHRYIRPEARHLRSTAMFSGKLPDHSIKPTFHLSYSGIRIRKEILVRVLEMAYRQIPLNPKAVRVLAVNITVERTCAEWHRAFSLWPAIERLELFEDLTIASWTLLDAATPNIVGQPDFLFPSLKKLVFSGRIRPTCGRLERLAENRKAAGIPIEIDFTEYVWRSVDIVTTLMQSATKVTWDGEEWMPFSLDNFEQIPDVEGQGVWGNMFDL
ncbi:hypothetical protein EWM64_g5912 [Hericium alpestre]|uniref:AB hydrolase-1 domain-containing protein n=1 Tax=Hericium alpestre TaxID=135208 RepID=A0A4Y9ZW27_9AGAM|nr:hypothetical protein EWM64_g5912 [Hericium alpestre]